MNSIIFSKSAQKFLNKIDKTTRKKLEKNILSLSPEIDERLKQIDKKRDQTNTYRRKLAHYRIVYQVQTNGILITHIDTKTNFKFKKTGCK